MKDSVKVELDRYEIGTIINALREFRNIKIREDINTDAIDDLYIKFANIYEKQCPLIKAMRKEYGR